MSDGPVINRSAGVKRLHCIVAAMEHAALDTDMKAMSQSGFDGLSGSQEMLPPHKPEKVISRSNSDDHIGMAHHGAVLEQRRNSRSPRGTSGSRPSTPRSNARGSDQMVIGAVAATDSPGQSRRQVVFNEAEQ